MRNRFPTGRRVTISDVAAQAGVSKTTVSKFLSRNDYYIADETRRRIKDAVRELDFRPNAVAQGLSNRRSQAVGVVVASVANPFYPELIAGVEEVIGAAGYTMLLGSSDGRAATESAIVESMIQRQVDGVVMASVTMRDKEVERLTESGVDLVLASRNLARQVVDGVTVDNHAGAVAATRHLLEHGHRRIAHLAGPQDILPFRLRRLAFRETMEAEGLSGARVEQVSRASSSSAVVEAVGRLLKAEEPPTAIFVGSDTMALVVLEECHRHGLEVPGDLAVVGYDNVWVGRLPGVSLSTVDSKARQVGRTAANLLCQRIGDRVAGAPARTPELIMMRSEFVQRGSCGC